MTQSLRGVSTQPLLAQYSGNSEPVWALAEPMFRIETCENTARAMGDSALFIKQRHIRNCHRADPSYGEGVALALGLSLKEALAAEDPAHLDWDER